MNWLTDFRYNHAVAVESPCSTTTENKSEIAGTQDVQKLLSLTTLTLWLSSSTLAMLDAGTVRKSLHVLGIIDSAIINTLMDTAMKMYNNGKKTFFCLFYFVSHMSRVRRFHS